MIMKRPKKPKEPKKPVAPTKTHETWPTIWKWGWPDDFPWAETPEESWVEVKFTVEEFRKKMPPEMWDPALSNDDLRVVARGLVYWDNQEFEIHLQKREVLENKKYDEQLERFNADMVKYEKAVKAHEVAMTAWEQLNVAYDAYEKSLD